MNCGLILTFLYLSPYTCSPSMKSVKSFIRIEKFTITKQNYMSSNNVKERHGCKSLHHDHRKQGSN